MTPLATAPAAAAKVRSPQPPASAEVELRPERIARVLLVVILALLAIGVIATSLMYFVAPDPVDSRLARAAAHFSISGDPTLINFLTSLLYVASAAGLAVVAADEARRGTVTARGWKLMAALLLGLGITENVEIHKMTNHALQDLIGVGGLLRPAWVVPASLIGVGVFIGFGGFLRRIDPRTARWIVLGGAIVVLGEIGFEMVSGVIVETWGPYTIPDLVEQVFEEGLAMVGNLVFLYGVLDHLRRHQGGIRLRLTGPASPLTTTGDER